jgi:hypothetical protein
MFHLQSVTCKIGKACFCKVVRDNAAYDDIDYLF